MADLIGVENSILPRTFNYLKIMELLGSHQQLTYLQKIGKAKKNIYTIISPICLIINEKCLLQFLQDSIVATGVYV